MKENLSVLTRMGGSKMFLTIGMPVLSLEDGVGAAVFVKLESNASDALVGNIEVWINI